MDEIKVTEFHSIESIESEKASYDIQIATAKKYPRDVKRSKNNALMMAVIDKDTAQSCGYALPRGGKTIQGASVHLARIIAQSWGNLRVESRIIEITDKQIVSQGMCFDLESNYAVKVEVRKSITDKYGKRFKDDMITVTGNAANAISYRNAVFSVIPKAITESIYKETKNVITGDLSNETRLIQRRDSALALFKDEYGATELQVLELLGIGSINAIKQDQIITLLGVVQSIKDGDTTAKELFKKTPDQKKEEMKKNNNLKTDMP